MVLAQSIQVQNPVLPMLRGDAMVVTEQSCCAHAAALQCDETPRTQVRGERACFGSWSWRLQSVFGGSYCLGD